MNRASETIQEAVQAAKAAPITGRCVWTGEELAASGDWIWRWPEGAMDEIDTAWRAIATRVDEPTRITAADFPLPGLRDFFDAMLAELEDGRGRSD